MNGLYNESEHAEAVEWINRAFRDGITTEITHEEEVTDEEHHA